MHEILIYDITKMRISKVMLAPNIAAWLLHGHSCLHDWIYISTWVEVAYRIPFVISISLLVIVASANHEKIWKRFWRFPVVVCYFLGRAEKTHTPLCVFA